jgi:hypothetical protein
MVRYAGGLIYALSLLLFSSTLASSDFREACVGSDASAVEKMLREGQDPNEVYLIYSTVVAIRFSRVLTLYQKVYCSIHIDRVLVVWFWLV